MDSNKYATSFQFYNAAVAPLIIEPLRYHFSVYTKSTNIFWDPDPNVRTIDIGESFDFNKVPIQEKPRIIVTRGAYIISKTGLSDNLAEGKPFNITGGIRDYTYFFLYSGTATITVEAKNKGACELITDMASHFIAWTRPILCDSQGWKEFGLNMAISDIMMVTDEDPGVPKFQANISIPWMKEERWNLSNDGVTLKSIISNVVATPSAPA
jgi:hypothetical protein